MIGPTDLLHPSPSPHFKTFQVFLIYCPSGAIGHWWYTNQCVPQEQKAGSGNWLVWR